MTKIKTLAYHMLKTIYLPIILTVHLLSKLPITRREKVYALLLINLFVYSWFNNVAVAAGINLVNDYKQKPIIITNVITETVYSQELSPEDEYYKRLNTDENFNSYIRNINVKLNNPGNLRCAGQPNSTCVNGFASFDSIILGFRALILQLNLDQSRNYTLEQFITKYSPPHENDTERLINQAAEWSGINRKDNITNINTIHLAQIMTRAEWSIQYE